MPPFSSHISSQFEVELESIRQRVMEMGGMVEQQLLLATRAVVEGNGILGQEVSDNDEAVNRLELAIDEACSYVLVCRQPKAVDLRLIYAIIKTITHLERIGDEAAKIGRMAAELASLEGGGTPLVEIGYLSQHVGQMVHDALDAFARMDIDAALAVAAEDAKVDRQYEGLMRQCITYMMEDPRTIRAVIEIQWILRSLERVGDHAQNISEYVVYLVKGKDIRHTSLEQVLREVGTKPGPK